MLRSRSRRGCFVFFTITIVAIFGCALSFLTIYLNNARRATAQNLSGTKIVYGLTLMPSGFDPHVNQASEIGIVLRSVYDTLIYRDPNSKEFVAGLAERWEISPDGLLYTFYLKSGVTFHDGTLFDAYAVAANLNRVVDPTTKSQKALFLLGPSYNGYTVVDPMTIQIKLNAPYAPLLDAFSQVYLGIASPKALSEYDTARYQFYQVGTGPYKMVDYIPNDHLTLQRNPNYTWGPTFYTVANPSPVEIIEFKFFDEPSTRAPALETNAAYVMGELPPTDAALFSRSDTVKLAPQPIPGQPLQFFFNTDTSHTNQADVRRAIIHATNRTRVVDTVFQQFSPVAYGPLSAVTPFYDPNVKDFYPYDKEQALKLLGDLNYTDSDNDKFLDLAGTKLSLKIVFPTWGMIPLVAQQMQSQWRDLGIDAQLQQVPNFGALMAAKEAGDYHLIAFYDFGLDPSIINRFYHSSGSTNFTKYIDNELDTWLITATQSTNNEERAALYSFIQTRIMEQALILPIRDYVNLNGYSTDLEGLTFDASGWNPLFPNIVAGENLKPQ